MKKKITTVKSVLNSSVSAGILMIIVAVITLEATSITQSVFSRKGIMEEASQRAESELDGARNEIMDIVNQAEAGVRNSVWIARWCFNVRDSLWKVPYRIVKNNPVIVGSTVALIPSEDRTKDFVAPYSYREMGTGVIKNISLASESYDYPSHPWFTKPIEIGSGYWSEPYFDEEGGNMLMVTYSLPVNDRSGRLAAVLTADISLDWLTETVNDIQTYPNSVSEIISREGHILVSTSEGEGLVKGQKSRKFTTEVEETGWTISTTLPEKDLFSTLRRAELVITLLQVLGIIMIIVIMYVLSRNVMKFKELSDQQNRMESELRIGRDIQMSMIPKTFPPFPERTDLDLAASIVPAKAVGGDLYDFYIRDNHLFFCIGDVSGKGVPAALVMAVTRSLFRSVSGHENSPARIVTTINQAMSETNGNDMFVTFFCGVLDLSTGLMRYSNAGHNPPLTLTDRIAGLVVHPNVPLGVLPDFVYDEQEIQLRYDDAIFLYTDGLTEAENSSHELFGLERTAMALTERRSSMDHLTAIQNAVSLFVGEAAQSDDLTMLFIHYLPDNHDQTLSSHISLTNDIKQIDRLAGFIDGIVKDLHLDDGIVNSINLAIEEAVTNVIQYAYPAGTRGNVDIDAMVQGDELSFTISDSGKPFDPTAAPDADVTLSVEDRPIGGLGIFLVRRIMDSVHYQYKNGRNELTITKKI